MLIMPVPVLFQGLKRQIFLGYSTPTSLLLSLICPQQVVSLLQKNNVPKYFLYYSLRPALVCVCMCVCVCEYTLQVIKLTIFWLGWLFVFVSIKSNSFYVKSDYFYLLKIWIYELLLINKNKEVFNNPLFLRILSIFKGNFYCNNLATVAVDINVETLKWNGILLSQFAQNIVEARFLRNITGWDYLLQNWFKIKHHERFNKNLFLI